MHLVASLWKSYVQVFFSDVSIGIDAVLHGLSNNEINFVGTFYLDILMIKILKRNDYFHESSITIAKL